MSGGSSDWRPEAFYAEVILTVQDRAPLLADPRLARRIVETAVEACRARGLKRVMLHASDAGRPLYESLGFRQTNEMRLVLT